MEYYSCDREGCESVSNEPFAVLCVDPDVLSDEQQKEWAAMTGEWAYYERHFCVGCTVEILQAMSETLKSEQPVEDSEDK